MTSFGLGWIAPDPSLRNAVKASMSDPGPEIRAAASRFIWLAWLVSLMTLIWLIRLIWPTRLMAHVRLILLIWLIWLIWLTWLLRLRWLIWLIRLIWLKWFIGLYTAGFVVNVAFVAGAPESEDIMWVLGGGKTTLPSTHVDP